MTYRQPTRAERADQHRLEMNTRKVRRAARTEGFDPMPNLKITTAYQQARIAIQMEFGDNLTPSEAHNRAIRRVRAALPPLRRDFFTPVNQRRPSKQDYVDGYCKPNVLPKSARVARQDMVEAA